MRRRSTTCSSAPGLRRYPSPELWSTRTPDANWLLHGGEPRTWSGATAEYSFSVLGAANTRRGSTCRSPVRLLPAGRAGGSPMPVGRCTTTRTRSSVAAQSPGCSTTLNVTVRALRRGIVANRAGRLPASDRRGDDRLRHREESGHPQVGDMGSNLTLVLLDGQARCRQPHLVRRLTKAEHPRACLGPLCA